MVDFQYTVELKYSVKTNFLDGTTQEYERYVNVQDYNEIARCYCGNEDEVCQDCTTNDGNCVPVEENRDNANLNYTREDCEGTFGGTWRLDPDTIRLDIPAAFYDSNGARNLVFPGRVYDENYGGGDDVYTTKTITFTVGSDEEFESGYFLSGEPWVRNNDAGVHLISIDPPPQQKLNAFYDTFMVNETVINPDTGKVLSHQVGQTSVIPERTNSIKDFEIQVTTTGWHNSTKFHKTCIPYKAWIIDNQPEDHGIGYEYLTTDDYNVLPSDGVAFDKVMNESEWITANLVGSDGNGNVNNGYFLGWDGRGCLTVTPNRNPAKRPPESDEEAVEQLSEIALQALNSEDGQKDKYWLYNWDGGFGWQRAKHFPRWSNQWQDRRNTSDDGGMLEWWENGNNHFASGLPGGDVDPEKPIPGLVEYDSAGNMSTPNGIRYWGSTSPTTSVQGAPNHGYFKAKDRSGYFKDREGTVRYSGVWDRETLLLNDHDFVSACISHYDEARVLYAREEWRRLYIRSFLQRPEYCGPDRGDSTSCLEGDERCNAACGDVWWLALSPGDLDGEGDFDEGFTPGTWNVHDTSGIPGSRYNPPLAGLYGLNEDIQNNLDQWEPIADTISDDWSSNDTQLLSGQGQIDYFSAANESTGTCQDCDEDLRNELGYPNCRQLNAEQCAEVNGNFVPDAQSYCVGCMECNEAQCASRGLVWKEDNAGYDYQDFVQYYDPDGDLSDPDNIIPISWSGWENPVPKLTPCSSSWGVDGRRRRSIIDMYGALVCVPNDDIDYSERFRPPFNWDPTMRYDAPYIEEREELDEFNFGGPVDALEPGQDPMEAQLYYPEYGMDNELWPRETPVDNNFNETCDCADYIDYDWDENPDDISGNCRAKCTMGENWRLSDWLVLNAWLMGTQPVYVDSRLGSTRPIFDPSERDDSVQGFNASMSSNSGEYNAIEAQRLHALGPSVYDKNMDHDPNILKEAQFQAETQHRLTDPSLFDGAEFRKMIRRALTQRGIDVWGAMASTGKFTSPNGGHSEPYDWYLLYALMNTGYVGIDRHFEGNLGSLENGTYKGTNHNSPLQERVGYGTFGTNLGDYGNVRGQSFSIDNADFMASAGPSQYNPNGGGYYHNCRIPSLTVTDVQHMNLRDTGYGEGAWAAGVPQDTDSGGIPQGTWTYDPSLQPGALPKRTFEIVDGEQVEITDPQGNDEYTIITLSVPEPATAGGTYGIGSFDVNSGDWVWETEDAKGNAIAPPSGIRGLMQEVAIQSAIEYDRLYFDLLDNQGKDAEEAEEILSTYQFYRPQLPEYFFVDGKIGGRDAFKENPDRIKHIRPSFINGFDVRQPKTVQSNGECPSQLGQGIHAETVPWLQPARKSISVENNGHWVLVNNIGSIGNDKFIGFSVKSHKTCDVFRVVNDTYRYNERQDDIPAAPVECGGRDIKAQWPISLEIQLMLSEKADIDIGDTIDLQPVTATEIKQRVAHFNCVNYATAAAGLGGAGNYDFTFRRGSLMMAIASRLMDWPNTKIKVDGSETYSQEQVRESFPTYWQPVYDKIVAFWTHPTLRFKASTCRVIGCSYELYLPGAGNGPENSSLDSDSPYYKQESDVGWNTIYRALVKQQILDPIGKGDEVEPHRDSPADMIYYWDSIKNYDMVPIAETPKSMTAFTTDDPGFGNAAQCMFDSFDGYQVSGLDEDGNPTLSPNRDFPPNNISSGIAMSSVALRLRPDSSNMPTTVADLVNYLPGADDPDDEQYPAYLGEDTVGLIGGWERYAGNDAIYVRSGERLGRMLGGEASDAGTMHYDLVSQSKSEKGTKKALYLWVNGTNNPIKLVLVGERRAEGTVDGVPRDPNLNWSQTWALPNNYKYMPETLAMWTRGFPTAFFFADEKLSQIIIAV